MLITFLGGVIHLDPVGHRSGRIDGGVKVQLECVALGNGELLVDVSGHPDLSEVMDELSKNWVWESTEGPVTLPPEEESEPTEWLELIQAKPKAEPQAAA